MASEGERYEKERFERYMDCARSQGYNQALEDIKNWCWEQEKKISHKLPDEYLNGFSCCCDFIRTELTKELADPHNHENHSHPNTPNKRMEGEIRNGKISKESSMNRLVENTVGDDPRRGFTKEEKSEVEDGK